MVNLREEFWALVMKVAGEDLKTEVADVVVEDVELAIGKKKKKTLTRK